MAYEFGPFRLEPPSRRLMRAGQEIPLTAKAFDVLVALLEQAGQVVEKGTLLGRLWPDAAVEEGNLAQQVYTARRALGDEEQRYIRTVSRRGYQFVTEVRKTLESAGPSPQGTLPGRASLPFPGERRGRRVPWPGSRGRAHHEAQQRARGRGPPHERRAPLCVRLGRSRRRGARPACRLGAGGELQTGLGAPAGDGPAAGRAFGRPGLGRDVQRPCDGPLLGPGRDCASGGGGARPQPERRGGTPPFPFCPLAMPMLSRPTSKAAFTRPEGRRRSWVARSLCSRPRWLEIPATPWPTPPSPKP